ncbi:hypothetical protein G3M48_006373 [Beauveria asiatica]|uniref:F-box domain-containing protein n=1 Tax=Beauveria asiatica TaxID=1069075 RepID=A0AAW0RPF6_9HYPO
MPVGLLSLSNELLTIIITFAAEASPDLSRTSILCRLRLTCSRISASATPVLFRSFSLRPYDPSIERFHALLNDPSPSGPRSLVRRVVFSCEADELEEEDDDYWGWKSWGPELIDVKREWHMAVARLPELENVQHVYVRFPPNSLGTGTGMGWITTFPNSSVLILRRTILVAVFEAIVSMRQSLRVLSIENLLNFVDTDFTKKSCFTKVITSIQELHISIAADIDEKDPRHTFPLPPPASRFWPFFASVWLAPASPHLSSLTLYCNVEFGAVPYWQDCFFSTVGQDTVALAFPRLSSLTLGRYALAYKSQVEDFLANAASLPELRRLTLDDCPIVSHLSLQDWDKISPVYRERLDMVKTMVLVGDGRHILASRLHWDTVFDRLREGLPSLKTFVFTRGPWEDDTAFRKRDSNVSRFLPRRYLSYHEDVEPTEFVEPMADEKDDAADGHVKYYFEVFESYDHATPWEAHKVKEDESLQPPSNDPKVHRAELEAFNRLNEALSQRRQPHY